jgi:ABC-type multidrug transport system fused ATPase/permease subunit
MNRSRLTEAWIQNTTLRENVLFGREWDEHRYWTAITNASLLPDLEILPDGDLTEVSPRVSRSEQR